MYPGFVGPLPDGCIPAFNEGFGYRRNPILGQMVELAERGRFTEVGPLIPRATLLELDDLLTIAPAYGDCDALARQLLEAGANVHGWDCGHRMRAIHVAAKWGRISVLRTLLEFGADVGARDERGYTPLHWIAVTFRSGIPSMGVPKGDVIGAMGLLLAASADINARDYEGKTPLGHIRPIADWAWARQWKLRGAHL